MLPRFSQLATLVFSLLVNVALVRGTEVITDDEVDSIKISLNSQEDEGELPPIIVRPDNSSTRSTAPGDSANSSDFPKLSDLQLGQSPPPFRDTTGVLRGSQSLFDTAAAASIRSQAAILERQAPDMFHALQNEVGVLMQRTAAGQASPFVRGLTGQQVLILVDGIRLNNSFVRRGPNQYFNTIDPGMLDHIEVLRGQGSVLWGSDAIGGAINLVTRSPHLPTGGQGPYAAREFSQYYNTSNSSPYSRLNVEGWVGQAGIFAGGSFLNVRDLDTGFDAFPRQPGTNYQQYAGDIKLNYMLSNQELLTFSLQHFQQDDLPRSDRFPGYPADRNQSNTMSRARFYDPQQRDLAYLRYQAIEPLPIMDALTVTASYHRQRENQTRGVPTTRFQETDVGTIGLNAVAAKELDQFGKLTSGIDWYYDEVNSSFGGSASGPIVPPDAYYERLGIFLNWDFALTERLDAVAGIRYEHIATAGTPEIAGVPISVQKHYQDWIGQVGLVYEILPELHLVGSVSEGFRAPNLDDLMANNPNVLQQGQSIPSLGLRPEHSIQYEIGIKSNYDRWQLQTFAYWLDLQDNIVSITAAPNTFASANQDSFVQGIELDGEFRLEDGWALFGNFWYTYGINQITQSPLSRIPPTQGIVGLRRRVPQTHSYFTIYTWLVQRQDRLDPVRDLSDERIPSGGTPGYGTLNLRWGRALGVNNDHHLSLSLENITDQPYLVHGSGVFGTGFTARLGYRWDF